MVELDDLTGLFQPEWFYDSVIMYLVFAGEKTILCFTVQEG